MTDLPTPNDALALRDFLDRAIAALPEVRHSGGYPVYPSAFQDFTGYLSRSPWHRADYTLDMKEDMRGGIESLPIGKIRSFLTMMIRIDRFSPGGLLGMLEDGTAERVVTRAEALVSGTGAV